MRQALSNWLRAWQRCPTRPRLEYEAWLHRRDGRAGMQESRMSSDLALVTVNSLRDPLSRTLSNKSPGHLRPEIGGAYYVEEQANTKMKYLMAKLSTGTRAGYDTAWRQWGLFCRARGRDPFLMGGNPAQRRADEEILLDYIVHLARYFKCGEGTIKLKLFGLRYQHLLGGLEDPLAQKGRIWLALGGIKRLSGGVERKFPVTIGMMRWMYARYDTEEPDDAVLWAAIVVGWFFLLRAGEFLAVDGAPWQLDRVLRGMDVQPRLNGHPAPRFSEADETVIFLRGSKTDQYNAGTIRNQFTTKDEVDHVKALAKIERLFPQRWGTEAELPLFRWKSGQVVRRSRVQTALRLAAAAEGIPAKAMGSHSLRIGGASAMYRQGYDVEAIRRFGRWSSDAVHAYLWETHDKQKGLAQRMVAEQGPLTVTSGSGPATPPTAPSGITPHRAARRR